MSGIDIDLLRREECKPLTTAQMNEIKNQFHPSNTANVNITPYHIYDTDEHVVGERREIIDGVKKKKPLYEITKIYNKGDFTNGANFNHNIASNIEDIFIESADLKSSNFIFQPSYISINFPNLATQFFWAIIGRTQALIQIGSDVQATNYTLYFTLRYTKTSDEWEEV